VIEVKDSKQLAPQTLGELFSRLAVNPPGEFGSLRSVSKKLGEYLSQPPDEILINTINQPEIRDGFRRFLKVGRPGKEHYSKATVKSYINFLRVMLQHAAELGWSPPKDGSEDAVPPAWSEIHKKAAGEHCADIVMDLALLHPAPQTVNLPDDLDSWVLRWVRQGGDEYAGRKKKLRIWRILVEFGRADSPMPPRFSRRTRYGIRLANFPRIMWGEVSDVRNWHTAEHQEGRPHKHKHRPPTADNFVEQIELLYGFVIQVLPEWIAELAAKDPRTPEEDKTLLELQEISALKIETLRQLIQKRIVSKYVRWCREKQHLLPSTVRSFLDVVAGSIRPHPSYKKLNSGFFKDIAADLPSAKEEKAAKDDRKAEKFLEFDEAMSIPAEIRKLMTAAKEAGAGEVELARIERDALLMEMFPVLAWRQKNFRECRIAKASEKKPANLFKKPIPAGKAIKKPAWVIEEEQRNPDAEFWQYQFSSAESKTKEGVHCILPRYLVDPLEKFLIHREHLLDGKTDPKTLFLDDNGKPMTIGKIDRKVSTLSLRHAGKRTTPHLYRDTLVMHWLALHPEDFLTAAKLLWDSLEMILKTYGSRFNESNGAAAMSDWLDKAYPRT